MEQFRFELSLSVLNHLGRNLYRNFVTVLGEAISNAWDADAQNVWIEVDREKSSFSIKDDGIGMTADDFQNKFLKIGYSKRKLGERRTPLNRPFIGAKGIGKLALLSCAERISIYTKVKGGEYVGGTIDNGQLETAITEDLTPQEYALEIADMNLAADLIDDHTSGTILVFSQMKEQMRVSDAHLRKIIALSFKFSLVDPSFRIFVNGTAIGYGDLKDIAESTQFAWVLNGFDDDYLKSLVKLKEWPIAVTTTLPITGFLATVYKPRDAKISMAEDRVSVDLFVNGRVRERNILRHIPTQRILESYVYGQIHFNSLDREGTDPFTSSREGIIEGDARFVELLDYLKKDLLPKILDKWDRLRLKHKDEGDDENTRLSRRQRKVKAFVVEAEKEYLLESGIASSSKVEEWVDTLRPDSEFNISAYTDCFISENLIRQFILDQKILAGKDEVSLIEKYKAKEVAHLADANISYAITSSDHDLGYLGMKSLSIMAEGGYTSNGKVTPLCRDDIVYTPIRNAVGQTSLLTVNAKKQLGMTLENIKARLKTLLGSMT
jgi:hypothetical protein